MKTSEKFDTAADLIEKQGWVRGPGGWYADGPLCLEGALMAAMELDVNNVFADEESEHAFRTCPEYVAMKAYLGLKEDQNVYRFNDRLTNHAEDIIAALRGAAEVERVLENAFDSMEVTA